MTDRTGLRSPQHIDSRPGPVRTCVGCRRTDSRSVLLRVVAETDGSGVTRLDPDPGARKPGRGAWLHPTSACLEQAIRRKAFGRALRLQSRVETERLTTWIGERS